MAAPRPTGSQDLFDTYFRRAYLDGVGHISGGEDVVFFQGSNLPKHVLAQSQRFLQQCNHCNELRLCTCSPKPPLLFTITAKNLCKISRKLLNLKKSKDASDAAGLLEKLTINEKETEEKPVEKEEAADEKDKNKKKVQLSKKRKLRNMFPHLKMHNAYMKWKHTHIEQGSMVLTCLN